MDDTNFKLLLENELIWVRMLEEVLKDYHIPCVTFPVYGSAFSLRTGRQERLRLYVPAEYLPRAEELRAELFSSEYQEEDPEECGNCPD